MKVAAAGVVLTDVTARHGAAVNEHLAAYDGINYEAGFTPRARMQKSLKSIAKSKVHHKFEKQNLKQQAGFSAEVIETSRARAEACVKGKRPSVLRMDDVGPKGARHSNDQLIDIVEVDANGNPIPSTGYQMKFVGGDARKCLDKLLGKKCRKYLDNSVDIAIPSDYYDDVKHLLERRAADIEKQIANSHKIGKKVPQTKLDELNSCKRLMSHLRKSSMSRIEAIIARRYPKLFASIEVVRQANNAGVEGAKTCTAVTGVVSAMGNLLAIARGDKSWKDAVIDTTKDALIAGASGYFTAAGGSAISGAMMHSRNTTMRAMGRSGVPGAVITFVASGASVLCKYFNGEVRGAECMDELASLGTSMAIGSASASAVTAIPGVSAVAVGGIALLPMAGAILGSMVASAVFTGLKNWAYKNAYAAEARARETEARCAEACKRLTVYKRQIKGYFKSSNLEFYNFMNETLFMIDSNDFETSVAGANKIAVACGSKVHVKTVGDVDSLMSSPFRIGR